MKRLLAAGAVVLEISLLLVLPTAPVAAAATPFSFAVIGDIPYGSSQLSAFPGRIGQISADSNVQLVSHLGDISSPVNCSDSYYSRIKSDFDKFVDPLVYTPGDNEWADCHRASVGKADPLNRLAAVRSKFFPVHGQTMGQHKIAVTAQSGYPENVMFGLATITFASVHLVGSYNDRAPWSGLGYTQLAEVKARDSAAASLIRSAFAAAKANNSRAVVLMTQADMFVGTNSAYRTAFQGTVRVIAAESAAFGRPVFLLNGDSHGFVSDKPLNTSKWLSFYGISSAVPNLSRITIEGGSTVDEWIKVNVVSTASVLQIQRVRYR
jgi:hypothetical protein